MLGKGGSVRYDSPLCCLGATAWCCLFLCLVCGCLFGFLLSFSLFGLWLFFFFFSLFCFFEVHRRPASKDWCRSNSSSSHKLLFRGFPGPRGGCQQQFATQTFRIHLLGLDFPDLRKILSDDFYCMACLFPQEKCMFFTSIAVIYSVYNV